MNRYFFKEEWMPLLALIRALPWQAIERWIYVLVFMAVQFALVSFAFVEGFGLNPAFFAPHGVAVAPLPFFSLLALLRRRIPMAMLGGYMVLEGLRLCLGIPGILHGLSGQEQAWFHNGNVSAALILSSLFLWGGGRLVCFAIRRPETKSCDPKPESGLRLSSEERRNNTVPENGSPWYTRGFLGKLQLTERAAKLCLLAVGCFVLYGKAAFSLHSAAWQQCETSNRLFFEGPALLVLLVRRIDIVFLLCGLIVFGQRIVGVIVGILFLCIGIAFAFGLYKFPLVLHFSSIGETYGGVQRSAYETALSFTFLGTGVWYFVIRNSTSLLSFGRLHKNAGALIQVYILYYLSYTTFLWIISVGVGWFQESYLSFLYWMRFGIILTICYFAILRYRTVVLILGLYMVYDGLKRPVAFFLLIFGLLGQQNTVLILSNMDLKPYGLLAYLDIPVSACGYMLARIAIRDFSEPNGENIVKDSPWGRGYSSGP